MDHLEAAINQIFKGAQIRYACDSESARNGRWRTIRFMYDYYRTISTSKNYYILYKIECGPEVRARIEAMRNAANQ